MLPFSHVHVNMQSQLRPVDQGKGHLEAFRKSCKGKDSVSPTKAGRVGGVLTLTLTQPAPPPPSSHVHTRNLSELRFASDPRSS